MITVVEGSMGSGMSMMAMYMAFMLREHLKNDPKVRPVVVDYEMSICDLEKRLNNLVWPKHINILRSDNDYEKNK